MVRIVALWAALCPATPSETELADRWLRAATAVLGEADDAERRLAALTSSGAVASDAAALRGLAALLQDDLRTARRLFPGAPRWATYRAMAELGRPGGFARARSHLASASVSDEAPAGVLFLAALAFFANGQSERAHDLLKRALALSSSVLDEAFAPDPAVAMTRLALRRSGVADPAGPRRRLADALIRAGRRGEGRRLVAGLSGPAAARIRWASWTDVDGRRAVAAARRAADVRPEMALVVAEAEFARGRAAKIPSRELPNSRWEARRQRLRALQALADDLSADAVDAARAAARLDPKEDAGIVLVVRALLATGERGRARAFARLLYERRSIQESPFVWLLATMGEGPSRRRRDLELRSRVWDSSQSKLRKARARRERVLAAARDADAGLGATGLDEVRVQDAEMGLPVDLAMAKYGRAGDRNGGSRSHFGGVFAPSARLARAARRLELHDGRDRSFRSDASRTRRSVGC